MRSTDRSCKTSRLTVKEFADAISNHYQTQTISDNGGSGWMAAPGLPVTPAASLYVTRDVQGLRQVTLRQTLSSTQISVSLLHTAVCQLRCALCEERAELSVATSDSLCPLYISAYTQVSRSPVYCLCFQCNVQYTIHTAPLPVQQTTPQLA